MTRNEAVKWLQRIRTRQTGGKDEFDAARREAIDMGIEMIEKSRLETPCDLCRFNDDPDTSEEALKLICAKCPAESVKLCS